MAMLPLSLVDVQAVATVATVLGVAVWERLQSNASEPSQFTRRQITNIGLFAINTALISGPVIYLADRFLDANLSSSTGSFLPLDIQQYLLTIWWFLMLDLSSYSLHRAFHAVPFLYRLHSAHHSDCDVDLTTALRRHPVEFMLNATATCAIGFLVGAPIEVIGGYGIVATVLQIWHHGNLAIPFGVDRIIGLVFVTPSMHRSHHALDLPSTNSNYGTVLSVWDRIFQTKFVGHGPYKFGVAGLEGPDHQRLKMVLLSPILVDLDTTDG